jgi:hypothetical protein
MEINPPTQGDAVWPPRHWIPDPDLADIFAQMSGKQAADPG